MKKIGSLFFFILFWTSLAQAKVDVQATVDRNEINQGDTFILTVSVSSDQGVNISEPRLPSLNQFQLMQSWTGTEARSTFTNGQFQTSRTRKFNYQLSAKQLGKVRVGPVEVIVNGQAYKTKIIDINVVNGGAASNSAPAQDPFFGKDPFSEVDDLFNQLLGRRQQNAPSFPQNQPRRNIPSMNTRDAFSIQVEVDKKKVYAGEQVTATWYLYTRGQVRDIDTLKYPSLNGFWKEDIQIATHLNFQNEIVNGIIYKKALLASYALFPIKPGKSTVDPYEAKVTIITTQGGFGFGRPQTSTRKSAEIPIEVMPLPPGAPANFTGAVGSYRVRSSVDRQQTTVNQPISLKLRFDGRGNAKLIELPELSFNDGLELYDTKSESKFFKNGRSYKEFELLLIPRQAGSFEIPALKFSIFNPQTKQYDEVSSQSISLEVSPSKDGQSIPAAPIDTLAGTDEEQVDDKDLPPQPLLEWRSYSSVQVSSLHLLIGGLLLSLITLLFKAKKELAWGSEKKSLSSQIKSRFDHINQMIKKEEWREVGTATLNTLYFALGDASGEGGASVEIEKLLLKMPPSIKRELGPEIRKQMELLQILGFAPEEVVGDLKSKKQMQDLVKGSEKLISQILRLRFNNSERE